MQQEQKELIYLYCVSKKKPIVGSFKKIGVKIYPIYFQGTYAVISKVSPDEFSEENLKKNLTDMKWVEEKVRQHEKVTEKIMKDTAVLPFKFGTVFKTQDNVMELLKKHSSAFKRIIANLEDKEEWGLKIYCDLERFKVIIEKENEKIKEIETEIASAGEGKAYLLKQKKEGFIKEAIDEKISEYTRNSFERLKRVSVESKINKILPKEVTEKKEDMVLNVAYLVNKKRIKEFNDIVGYLKTKYSDMGLSFECTGPWPPYNFCSIDKKEGSTISG